MFAECFQPMVSTMGNMMSPWLKSWVGMKPLKNASAAKKNKNR